MADTTSQRPPVIDDPATVRVFVGTDQNQILAFRALEYSIRRHTDRGVQIVPLVNVTAPQPRHRRNRSRTGFTFARFMIPSLCRYRGRAIYLDADMLVFRDIGELWDQPMPAGVRLLYSEPPLSTKRVPQFSVLVMDCSRLDWRIEEIIKQLDEGVYDYEALVYRLALLPDNAKAPLLPFAWNSLKTYEPGETAPLHYTEMPTQPWVSSHNRNGDLWYAALRAAIDNGFITLDEVAAEINRGHVSPALPKWIERDIPGITISTKGWMPPYRRLPRGPLAVAQAAAFALASVLGIRRRTAS